MLTTRGALLALVAAAVASSFYFRALDTSPIYLTKDEASFAIQSHSIATTGNDLAGQPLPLYFQERGFSIGRDPIYIYMTALLLQFLPLDERTIRLPSVAAGVLAIGLTVLVARELFQSYRLAGLAALFLALTPAFFIRSRAALSVIFPVPFQLIWLYGLLVYWRTGRPAPLIVSTCALGLGVYSYLGMLVFAPIQFLVTAAATGWRKQWRHLALAAVCLGVLLVPLAAWQWSHPDRLSQIVGTYRLYEPRLSVLQGTRDLLTWFSVGTRLDAYWQAFNPGRLFFSGESSLNDSTRLAGLFPLAYLVLLPLGLYELSRKPWSLPKSLIGIGFFIAPLPSLVLGEDTIGRYLLFAPLAALIATAGIARLWGTPGLLGRGLATVTVASAMWLFGGFYLDYMGDWRVRSAASFGGNIKGAMAVVMKSPVTPDEVYLSERIPYVDTFWEYHRRSNGRADLAGRSRGLSFALDDWKLVSGNAFAIVESSSGGLDDLKAAGWSMVAEVGEPEQSEPSFLVFARESPKP